MALARFAQFLSGVSGLAIMAASVWALVAMAFATSIG
jgi:hypothetical protein